MTLPEEETRVFFFFFIKFSHLPAILYYQPIHLTIFTVEILPPAMPDGKDDEIGFAAYVGDFDVLLDTVHDERPSRLPQINDNDDNDNDNDAMMGMGTTLRLLRQRHQCERYVSSMTQAQRIINAEGVLFGPGKVKNHVKELV